MKYDLIGCKSRKYNRTMRYQYFVEIYWRMIDLVSSSTAVFSPHRIHNQDVYHLFVLLLLRIHHEDVFQLIFFRSIRATFSARYVVYVTVTDLARDGAIHWSWVLHLPRPLVYKLLQPKARHHDQLRLLKLLRHTDSSHVSSPAYHVWREEWWLALRRWFPGWE